MKAEGPQRVWTATPIGARAPLHATAAGKAWIAHLPSATALKLVLNQGMVALTERTITDPDRLTRELALTRERGYALNVGEVTLGVNSVAVPVWHSRRQNVVIGSVVVTAPEFRVAPAQLAPLAPILRAAADKIGELMPLSPSTPTGLG
jgi:DNA-binding IclR family transcriptional regulator